MIKLKNRSQFLVPLNVPGDQTAAVNKAAFLVPFACRLRAIYTALGTAGITGNQDVDINKNGTSILDSANKIRFATTVATPSAGSIDFTSDPITFAKGDVITVDVDAVHSGTAAKNLMINLVLERTTVSGPVATTTDGIGPENE